MREIKFRVWEKERGAMLYPPNHHLSLSITGSPCNLQTGQGGDDYILMQYTGLKDKNGNGKAIYEGDIVRVVEKGVKFEQIGEIKFGKFESSHEAGFSRYHYHQGFYIVNKKGEQLWDTCGEDIIWDNAIVIGNIYENPELLDKE